MVQRTKRLKTKQVVLATWKTTRAYPSDGAIRCAGYHCGRMIPEGEYYTRRKPQVAGFWYSQHPFCQDCISFKDADKQTNLYAEWAVSVEHAIDEMHYQERFGNRPQMLMPDDSIVILRFTENGLEVDL